MTITLTVAGRIATVDATTHVVAGNTYPVALSLDSEWTGSLYLRVRFGSLYYDIPFASSDTSVDVQMPVGYPEVGIGVFSEALEICTNEARVRLLRSILEAGEQVVEFDSDLYDQWAGEVSELLCDDAFDAESDRPVKNSVITAWKDTVPLDSALVHKTGNESIAGTKTFTYSPTIQASNVPTLDLRTGLASDANSWKGRVVFYDKKSGADSLVGDLLSATASTHTVMSLRASAPDRATQVAIGLRANSDGTAWAEAPSYTANNNADTKIVTRSMLATTPTVVHTTGNETIAGAKTFTSLLTASNVYVKDASTPTVTMLKGSTEVASLASDGTQAGLTASSQFFGLRGLGTAPFGQAPSYTADNSADAKIVTRSMLATTPTVVHTTGNETVAGRKSFSENITGLCSLRTTDASTIGTAGQYKVVMRIEKAKVVGTRTHTLLYFVTRQRGRGFDLISLYSNNTNILSFEMNLRSNQENYTYILSEDSTYGYISIICKGDTGDTVQAGVLFSTEPSTKTGAFGSESPDTPRDTIPGTEIMRLTT